MKKQLLAAAVAATMTSVATADISITGDAKFEYFNTDNGTVSTNTTNTEVNLGIKGQTGNTAVVANVEINTHGSNNANGDGIDVEDLYMTTSIGDVAIKAGNYTTSTSALGGEMDQGGRANNKVALSTKVGPATVGYSVSGAAGNGATALNSDAASVTISMPVAGYNVSIKEESDTYTMVGVSGSVAGFDVRYEHKNADAADSDESFGNITTTASGLDLGFAWYDGDADGLNDEDDSAIFAVENASSGDSNQQFSASTTVDGNKVTVKAGKIGFKASGTNDRDYTQVGVSRALASGAKLALTYTDKDTSNTADEQKFEADLSVTF